MLSSEARDGYTYLRGEHSIVFGRTAGEVLAACSFNEGAEAGDADDVKEGDLDGDRRRDEDGVHGVIGHSLTDGGLVQHHSNVMGLEVGLRPNSAQH